MQDMLKARSSRDLIICVIVILVYLSPHIFFPYQARYLVHDNLDSNPVWYKNLADSGKMFAANDEIIPNSMGGIPRGCYPSEWNLFYLSFLILPMLFAYNLNIVIMHLVAFASMFIFSRRYIFKADPRMAALLSLCFALLPFWPSGLLSLPAQPLLLYAFLNILKRVGSWKDWLIIFALPFYSVLVFSNMFFCILLGLGLVIYFLKKRTFNFPVVLALGMFMVVSVLIDHRLFEMQFLEKFESHRATNGYGSTLNLKGLAGVSLKHFLFGHYHFISLQLPLILPFCVLALLLASGMPERRMLALTLVLLMGISVLFVLPDWKGFETMVTKIPMLKMLSLRFHSLFPLLWLISFALALKIVSAHKLFRMAGQLAAGVFVLFAFTGVMQRDYYNSRDIENTFYRTWVNPSGEGFVTFEQYYKTGLFSRAKAVLPTGNYHIACIGVNPEAAQYNGYYTIDGYYYYYSKTYNNTMSEIAAGEMRKIGMTQLGSRCYLPSQDILQRKPVITEPDLNFDRMLSLGARYVFCDRPIVSSRLHAERSVFEGKERLFIYNIR
jgi:hypothetical protein